MCFCCFSLQYISNETSLSCPEHPLFISFSLSQSALKQVPMTQRFSCFFFCLVCCTLTKQECCWILIENSLIPTAFDSLLHPVHWYSHLSPPSSHQVLRDINISLSEKHSFFLSILCFPNSLLLVSGFSIYLGEHTRELVMHCADLPCSSSCNIVTLVKDLCVLAF